MNEEIRQAIHLRLGQARETLEEANALRDIAFGGELSIVLTLRCSMQV